MAYIGQGIKQGTFKVLDTSGNTYNGSNTTFSLGTQVGAAAQLLVSHDGVIQLPGTDYTLASGGASITFSTAPASGASIFIVEISGAVGGTVTPSDNSVGITQLNLSDGSNGQFIKTDGSGTLSFATVDTSSATDSFAITGSTPTLTIGDAGAEDTKIVFDGNAQDYHIGLDDSTDDLVIGLGSSLGTTSHIVTDEAGHVTKPLNPAFRVYQDDNTDYATNHTMYNQNITEVYDVNGDMGTNGSFTAPVTGKYLFTMSIYDINATENTAYDMMFITSNRNYRWGFYGYFRDNYTGNTNFKTEGHIIVDMDANDTAYVKNGANATITNGSNSEHSYFSGILIG